jgi:hypothetical protein
MTPYVAFRFGVLCDFGHFTGFLLCPFQREKCVAAKLITIGNNNNNNNTAARSKRQLVSTETSPRAGLPGFNTRQGTNYLFVATPPRLLVTIIWAPGIVSRGYNDRNVKLATTPV